ncbi:hypothetical protein [Nocardia wallacei]|uniref:hypothetical protein n=1 Tax=Nocardia wallacei TaxID=480035 RepID=UPI002456B5C2|nr:hypothetical protein [Nocardia wallacei]
MATTTISMDDHLFAQIQEAAGDDLSAWIAAACRDRLLSDGVRTAVVWEKQDPAAADPEHARVAWLRCGGHGAGPTDTEITVAEQRVRALFARADRRLRDQHQDHQQ